MTEVLQKLIPDLDPDWVVKDGYQLYLPRRPGITR